jgi:SagB-type dehydrogenase family enzyme
MLYEEEPYMQSEMYHEASKINNATGLALRRRIATVLGAEYYLKLISRGYKSYPMAQATALPSVADLVEETPESKTFRNLVLRRRSLREFAEAPIPLNDLTSIIFNAYGLTATISLSFGVEQKLRGVPSGGALYPLELYAVAFRVDGLPSGVYHYNVEAHSLELLREGQFDAEFGRAVFYEDMFKTVSAAFVITGVPKRSAFKYGERAYRFINLEAGHVGQNICMTATALGIGCLMVGGFYDDDIDSLVGIDGLNELSLYTAAVGYPKQQVFSIKPKEKAQEENDISAEQ